MLARDRRPHLTSRSVAGTFWQAGLAVWTLSLPVITTSAFSPPTQPALVDFVAFDQDGRPVPDLRASDLTIKVGGDTAQINTLRALPPMPAGPLSMKTLPFGSVESTYFQRSFLIIVDEESIPQGSEQTTKDAISSFVRGLGATDQVGLATVPHGMLRVGMTAEHGRLLQALRSVAGRGVRDETVVDAACRTRNVVRDVISLLESTDSPYGPLTVVFFSASMFDGGEDIRAAMGTFLSCDFQTAEFRRVVTEAGRTRAYFYVVQPEIPELPKWSTRPRAGLEQLAGATGGRILQMTGRGGDRLTRIDAEMSLVYVASIGLNLTPRGERSYSVSVKTSRRGVTIRARPTILLTSAGSVPAH